MLIADAEQSVKIFSCISREDFFKNGNILSAIRTQAIKHANDRTPLFEIVIDTVSDSEESFRKTKAFHLFQEYKNVSYYRVLRDDADLAIERKLYRLKKVVARKTWREDVNDGRWIEDIIVIILVVDEEMVRLEEKHGVNNKAANVRGFVF